MAQRFTERQGQYLAFIHLYTLLNRIPPAEADIQAYFGVSAPAVHQMVITLHNIGLIERIPRQARSIRLLVSPHLLPTLEGTPSMAQEQSYFESRYPHIAAWIDLDGYVEIGYDYNTDTCVRALDEGGMVWSGGQRDGTLEEWLQALNSGVKDFMKEQGME